MAVAVMVTVPAKRGPTIVVRIALTAAASALSAVVAISIAAQAIAPEFGLSCQHERALPEGCALNCRVRIERQTA